MSNSQSLNYFQEQSVPKVLWLDDEPQFISIIRRLLKAAKISIVIDEVETAAEASRRLDTEQYSAIVADYCLDVNDRASNSGASFLSGLGEHLRSIPKFVYSAFLDDPVFTRHMGNVDIIEYREKTHELPISGLAEDAFFKTLQIHAMEYNSTSKFFPEKIPFDRFIENPNVYSKEMQFHWKKHGTWITKELQRKGYVWGVACGNRIVNGSDDYFEFPNEKKLFEIGRYYNLVPFAYGLPAPVETIPWGTTKYKMDKFPRIDIRFNNRFSDDFDTGAAQTHVSDEIVSTGFLDAVSQRYHLGKSYLATVKTVVVHLIASNGDERNAEMPLTIVKNWANSPFVDVNPNRKVLIGRDILRAFKIQVLLNSKTQITQVMFVE